MNTTLLLVLAVVFSFAAGHRLSRFLSRFVTLTGAEYLLVGALIGPQMPLHLVSEAALAELEPLVSLLVGLLAFVLGIRAHGVLRRTDAALAGLVTSVGVLLVVLATALVVFALVLPVDEAAGDFVWSAVLLRARGYVLELHVPSEHLYLALGLAASASACSAATITSARKLLGVEGPLGELLGRIATIGQIVAVLTLGFTLAAGRATDAARRLSIGFTEWAVASIGLGVVCGLLFSLFIGRERDGKRIFIASVGAVTFASGIGLALGVSSMFVNLLAGITVAATSQHADRLHAELDRLEHPLFVLVMIFGGATWIPVHGALWLLPIGYAAVRWLALRVAARFAATQLVEPPVRVARFGHGLLAQGTLAVAIGINFSSRFPEQAPVLLSTVLLGTLISDLFSVRALRSVLLDAGEASGPVDAPRSSSRPSDAEART